MRATRAMPPVPLAALPMTALPAAPASIRPSVERLRAAAHSKSRPVPNTIKCSPGKSSRCASASLIDLISDLPLLTVLSSDVDSSMVALQKSRHEERGQAAYLMQLALSEHSMSNWRTVELARRRKPAHNPGIGSIQPALQPACSRHAG